MIMDKKYITFYQDFLNNKDSQKNVELEEIKKHAQNEKIIENKIFYFLGLLRLAVESEKTNYSEFAINYLKSKKSIMTKFQSDLFKMYHAKFLYNKKDYAGSYLLLKPLTYNQKSSLFPLISNIYLDSMLNLNLNGESLDFYTFNSNIIEQNTNWEKLNEIYVKLSNAALYFNKPNLALSFLKKPLLFYPQEKSSIEAMDILSKIECAGGSLGSLYLRDENMQYLSKEVYKRIGKHPDSRNYILALVGIDPLNPTPSQNLESLSTQDKDKLLGIADLLISAREYKIANNVLNYLSNSEKYNDPYNKDKIFDMRGKVFNALQKPLKAAEMYYKLFNEIPKSNLAENAKIKYAMSLHFAQKHADASIFISKNTLFPSKYDQNWLLFWEYYLASKFKEAESTANDYTNLNDSNYRLQYWLSIIEKERGDKKKPIKRLTDISKKNLDYPYPIFAKWQLNNFLLNTKKNNKINKNFTIKDYYSIKNNPFLKKKLHDKKLEQIRQLIHFNLTDVAMVEIKSINIKKMKKNNIITLANLAYSASDYKMSSDLARKYFPNTLDNFQPKEILNEKTNFWKLNFPIAYWNDIKNASALADIDPFWLLSIMRAESLYSPIAESSVGAIGLMQIMPYTAINISKHIGKKYFNISLLKDPSQSIVYAAWYLRMLLKIYNDNYLLATAAYNSGPEAVNRWINQNDSLTIDEFYENIPFQETKKYVAKVLGYLDIYYRVQLETNEGYNLDIGESLPDPFTKLNIF